MKSFCKYCDREVKLFRMNGMRFIPHGDSLGSCPNTGRRPTKDAPDLKRAGSKSKHLSKSAVLGG